MPLNPRQRVIFLIAFAVPVISALVCGFVYNVPDVFPVAGLLALVLGAIYIRLLKVRRPTDAPRRRKTSIAIKLYVGFAMVAGINIIAEGWHWYDLLYLVFPTVVSVAMLRPDLLKKESAQSND